MSDPIDTGWSGTPAAVEVALAGYGYVPNGSGGYVYDGSADPGPVLGVLSSGDVDGQHIVRVRSSASVPLPAGLTAVGARMLELTVGVYMTDGTETRTQLSGAEFAAKFSQEARRKIWLLLTTPNYPGVSEEQRGALGEAYDRGKSGVNILSDDAATWVGTLQALGIITQAEHDYVLDPTTGPVAAS